MLFKMIANKPMYRYDNGEDPTFGQGLSILPAAVGDPEGNPVAQTG